MDNNFTIFEVTDDAFWFRLFPYSLRSHAKGCLNSLETNSISTWNTIAEKFQTNHFYPIKNARIQTYDDLNVANCGAV